MVIDCYHPLLLLFPDLVHFQKDFSLLWVDEFSNYFVVGCTLHFVVMADLWVFCADESVFLGLGDADLDG